MELGNDGASDDSSRKSLQSLTSGENENSAVEFRETPGGAENVSDVLPTSDGVSGIFNRRVQRDAIDGLSRRSSAGTDASTNLKPERRSSRESLTTTAAAAAAAASSANWPSNDCSYSVNDFDKNNAAANESCDSQEKLRDGRKPFVRENEPNAGGEREPDGTKTIRSAADHGEANAFFDRCAKRRPIAYYDYSCRKRKSSARHAPADELLTLEICKKWFESNETELDFLRGQFSEVLPRVLHDVVTKRIADPVHYVAHCLIKYKVDKSMNAKTFGPNRPL